MKESLRKKVQEVAIESSLRPKYSQFGNKEGGLSIKSDKESDYGELNKKRNENEYQGGHFWVFEGTKKKLKKEAGWIAPELGQKETGNMSIEGNESELVEQMIKEESGNENKTPNISENKVNNARVPKKDSESIDISLDEFPRRSTREKREPRKNYDKALMG